MRPPAQSMRFPCKVAATRNELRGPGAGVGGRRPYARVGRSEHETPSGRVRFGAGVVGGAALSGRPHRRTECLGQPDPIGELGEQERSRVGDQTFTVRPDFYRSGRRSSVHFPGVLLVLGMGCRKPHSHRPGGRSRALGQALIGGSGLAGNPRRATEIPVRGTSDSVILAACVGLVASNRRNATGFCEQRSPAASGGRSFDRGGGRAPDDRSR